MKSKKDYHILTINPGSTSTKIGLFKNEELLFDINVNHSPKQLENYNTVWDQYTFRKQEIVETLENRNFDLGTLDAVVGRGGLIKPISSGTYIVDQEMIEDAREGVQGHHASNLGCVIAYSIGWEYAVPALIVDPPAVDDMEPLARFSGNKHFSRSSLFHALNAFATARLYAEEKHSEIEKLNLIVAHMGGGISISAIRKGKTINANHGLYEGPFTPERSGNLPLFKVLDAIDKGTYTIDQIRKMTVGQGGLVSYFGTNNAMEIEDMAAAGSEEYKQVFEAMAYQIAEEIGKRAANLKGEVDAVLLTGGLAYSKMLTNWIKERTKFIAEVKIYPGAKELEALALGALRMLKGKEKAKNYTPKIYRVGVIYWDNVDVYVKTVNHIEDRFREAGFIFRKTNSNLEFVYENCKRSEENVRKAVSRFKYKDVDLIFAVGSPASFRIGQYLKHENIPVIYTGIYNSNIISNTSVTDNKNFSATCYAVPIKEQIENTAKKISGKIPQKLGAVYKRGEYQSEVQLDEIKDYCRKENVKLFDYEVQEKEDFIKARKHFEDKGAEWIFICAGTDLVTDKTQELKEITHHFPTIAMHEDIVYLGAFAGWVIPAREISSKATDMAFNILDNGKPKQQFVIPKARQLTINKEVAQILKFYDKLKDMKGDIQFV